MTSYNIKVSHSVLAVSMQPRCSFFASCRINDRNEQSYLAFAYSKCLWKNHIV